MSENRDISAPLPDWIVPKAPSGATLEGDYARLERLNRESHAILLHQANTLDDAIWAYLPYGPFPDIASYADWVESTHQASDPMFYAIYDKERGAWGGVASYMRITPQAGSIEVGHINFGAPLQRTRAATEAMALMMQWAFEAGYRRFEWKCNAANAGSRRAAQRLGLSFEGIFRQAAVVKGCNRDTAWFAAIDAEWPALQNAFRTWLSPGNFDKDGRQKLRLSELTAPVRVSSDPTLG